MSAPVKLAKTTATVGLCAGTALLAVTTPFAALVAVVGMLVSAVTRAKSIEYRSTKRRVLESVVDSFGLFAVLSYLLGGLALLVFVVVFHRFPWVPILVASTLLACWGPFLASRFRRDP